MSLFHVAMAGEVAAVQFHRRCCGLERGIAVSQHPDGEGVVEAITSTADRAHPRPRRVDVQRHDRVLGGRDRFGGQDVPSLADGVLHTRRRDELEGASVSCIVTTAVGPSGAMTGSGPRRGKVASRQQRESQGGIRILRIGPPMRGTGIPGTAPLRGWQRWLEEMISSSRTRIRRKWGQRGSRSSPPISLAALLTRVYSCGILCWSRSVARLRDGPPAQ